jgi:hypothetical protein
MQKPAGFLHPSFIYQVIYIGDTIFKGTAETVTKRCAAVHTPGGFLLNLVRCKRQLELGKIFYSLLKGPAFCVLPVIS